MRKLAPKLYLKSLTLRFREDEDPYERDAQGAIVEEDGEKVLKEGWEYDDDDKPVKTEDVDDDSDGKGDKDGEDENAEKIAALEESLAKERKLRRKIERDAKRAARQKSTDKQDKDDAELQKQLDASNARSEKLAKGLLKKEIDSAIMAEARKQGFIDPSDALTDAIREEIDADQDDEDPTDIDIDAETVRDAVKELASKKKHLLGSSSGDGEPSGSRFSKKKKKDEDKTSDQTLQHHYPSLR